MTVQISDLQADGELRITVTGEFGFETARELLLVCKARWRDGARTIKVNMSGVTGMTSSGIGTLVLLSELAGDDRFELNLEHCSEDVRHLFSSGMLDRYFKRSIVCCDGSSQALQAGGEAREVRRA